MHESEILIIGGGPAGASCAKELKRAGRDVLILDKADFPRSKLCAGWLSPGVFRMLKTKPQNYPGGLLKFRKLYFHFGKKQFGIPTKQFSIRRYEFDQWLVEESGTPVQKHNVRQIRKEQNSYIVDDLYTAQYIIGASGTSDPVYRTLFRPQKKRSPEAQIVAMEQEFIYDFPDDRCHLWFYDNGLAGYSWYVPKANGYINIGIGAKVSDLKNKGQTIQDHWQLFVKKLNDSDLISNYNFNPRGYQYYLRSRTQTTQTGHAYLIGDALGLATIDMGEGIAPAIASGLRAAQAILKNKPYKISGIHRLSFPGVLFPF